MLRFGGDLPHAIANVAIGCPVRSLIRHPLLVDPSFIMKSVIVEAGEIRMRFRWERRDLAFTGIAPKPRRQWQQLGRDSSLAAEAAVRDLLERSHAWPSTRMRPPLRAAVYERALSQLRTLDMMTPPWAARLRSPTMEEAAGVVQLHSAIRR